MLFQTLKTFIVYSIETIAKLIRSQSIPIAFAGYIHASVAIEGLKVHFDDFLKYTQRIMCIDLRFIRCYGNSTLAPGKNARKYRRECHSSDQYLC